MSTDSLKHIHAGRPHIPSQEEAGMEAASPAVQAGPVQAEYPKSPIVHRGQDPELFWLGKYGHDDTDDRLRVDIRSEAGSGGRILICCVDGLAGFSEAIARVFPQTLVQLCIVHMLRNSLHYVAWKDRKAVARDLRQLYRAPTEAAARAALDAFAQRWDAKYPTRSRSWHQHWEELSVFFAYPKEIRRVIRRDERDRITQSTDAQGLEDAWCAARYTSTE